MVAALETAFVGAYMGAISALSDNGLKKVAAQIGAITGGSLANESFYETTRSMLERILLDGVMPRAGKDE